MFYIKAKSVDLKLNVYTTTWDILKKTIETTRIKMKATQCNKRVKYLNIEKTFEYELLLNIKQIRLLKYNIYIRITYVIYGINIFISYILNKISERNSNKSRLNITKNKKCVLLIYFSMTYTIYIYIYCEL